MRKKHKDNFFENGSFDVEKKCQPYMGNFNQSEFDLYSHEIKLVVEERYRVGYQPSARPVAVKVRWPP